MRGQIGLGFVASALVALAVPALIVRAAPPSAAQVAGLAAFGINLVVMAAIVFGFGFAITGRVLGVTLSAYNDYSLSKLQMALWTVVVLAALLAVAEIRVFGLFGPCDDPLEIPIPGTLLAAMGISVFTTAATPAILALKTTERPNPLMAHAAFRRLAMKEGRADQLCIGKVVARLDEEGAILADLVTGDEVANAATVDLTKVQQLLITLLLLGTYVATVVHMLDTAVLRSEPGIAPHVAALVGLDENGAAFATKHVGGVVGLPDLSRSFVELLGVSHAGYLFYKAAPKSGAPAPGPEQAAPRFVSAMSAVRAAPATTPSIAIPIRLAIAEAESVSGLVLRCDGQAVSIDEAGFAELSLTPETHRLTAEGLRDGRPVRAEMSLAPDWDDYNRPVTLALA